MRKLLTILGLTVISFTAHGGFSLQQSMQTAFERNPKTQANDLRLKAMEERTRAAWLEFMPTFHIGYSVDSNQSSMNAGRGQGWQSSRSTSRSLSYGLSFNIYDGGVRYYSAKAAEAGEKARKAQYNSTDSRIPNTRGAIAEQVFNAYTNIIRIHEQTAFENNIKETLTRILKVARTPDEQKQIKARIASNEARLSDLKFQLEDAARDFENVVKLPMPSQIDDFDQTVKSIILPDTPEAAWEAALVKSPELNVASYQLEQMKLDYKADRAALTRPQINAHVNRSHGTSRAGEDPFNSRSSGSSVGVTLSWNFSAARHSHNKAAALEVEAAQKDKDGALDDLRFKIETTYPKLENYAKNVERYDEIFKSSEKDLVDMIQRIDQGEKIPFENAKGLLSAYENVFYPLVQEKQQLLVFKFDLQKTIGTLFDETTERALRRN